MEDWTSDNALAVIAEDLGHKVVEMYISCGIPIPHTYFDPKGPHHDPPSQSADDTIVGFFVADTLDFASLDPQKIIDEYQRMQKAADATGTESSEADVHLITAQTLIAANWHGDAAIAFAEQMTRISKFMDQQQERLVYAMQAMGMAFGLAVQFRQSYYDLAATTRDACKAVIAKRPAEPSVNSFMFALGSEMVKLAVGAIGAKDPKELKKIGIDWLKQEFEKAKNRVSIEANEATQVLRTYLDVRDHLRRSFDEGLGQLSNWLDGQRSAYFSLPVPILEPMPACTDVHEADFSYGRFFNDHHDPNTYSPKVESERKRFAAENPRHEGPIHRRLKGEE